MNFGWHSGYSILLEYFGVLKAESHIVEFYLKLTNPYGEELLYREYLSL